MIRILAKNSLIKIYGNSKYCLNYLKEMRLETTSLYYGINLCHNYMSEASLMFGFKVEVSIWDIKHIDYNTANCLLSHSESPCTVNQV